MIEQPIRITAAICTHNRAALLPAAIKSLLAQSLPPTDYELLVIDNASTDETPQIIQRYLKAPGRVTLRSAVQPLLGLSHARNLAVQMAEGEIIAFMDDDAVADPAWLEALLDAYALHPDAWAVGGKVLPMWDGERPFWLTDDLLPLLSLLDLGADLRPLEAHEELLGVNCSFRRCVFEEFGAFRTDLGRSGVSLLGSEESELQNRLRRHDRCVVYAPSAVVYHRIMAEKLRWRYFVRLAYDSRRTQARLIMPHARPVALGWRIGRGGLSVIRHWFSLLLHPLDQTRQLHCLRMTARWLGFTREVIETWWRQRHSCREHL